MLLQKSCNVGDDAAGPWRRDPVLNFEALGQSGSPSERTPVNHPHASPCMVTILAMEWYATTSPYRPTLHVDWPSGGGRGLARGRRRWPGSVLLGSLLDSDILGFGIVPPTTTCYPEAALGLSLGHSHLKAIGSLDSGSAAGLFTL